jgi:hypothetical protein
MARFATVALASYAWLLHANPITAQSVSGFELARTSFTSVRHYVASDAIPRQLAPPLNVVLSDAYRPIIESMLRDSPTFRRQCIRIAAEPHLRVFLRFAPLPLRSDFRATTQIRRHADGHLTASISIAPLEDSVEMIAHEFEHIIEQLDGVDLAARAALPRTGVNAISAATAAFETIRAKRIGLRVRSEVRTKNWKGRRTEQKIRRLDRSY